MVAPLAIAGGAVLLPVLHEAGSALALPFTLEIEAAKRAATYRFNRAEPLLLPDPASLVEIWNRRLAGGDSPFRALYVDAALQFHGVNLGQTSAGNKGGPDKEMDQVGRECWRAAMELSKHVPGVEAVADARRRNLIDEPTARKMLRRAGADVEKILAALPWGQARPGPGDVIESWVRGRLDTSDLDERLRRAGADPSAWYQVEHARFTIPTVRDCLEASNRGLLTGGNDLEQYLLWNGVKEDDARRIFTELAKGLPGVSDLNMFGIRHSWQPELVERYGYYLEFPERLRDWYGKLGLNYNVGFDVEKTEGVRPATLADAYWASHWHVLPLASAFAAYQRFQPDLVRRFQGDNPNLKPFTREDLNVHMRQADFPPGVRDWLVALAHPVLGRRDINWGVQFLGWDRAEMQSRFRLLGYTTDDAAELARIAEARENYRSQAWVRSVETRAHQQTIRMIEGLYTDGTIDRPFALRQLSDAGLPDGLSTQLLDVADFGVERSLVRASVTATSRDYLSGVLSRADAETQLRRIGIQDARVNNYLAAWGIQRSARRKRIETGKIASLVTAGLLGAGEARARLANLQWSDPDATLLLAEAEGKLAKRLAAQQKSAETDARQRAKELERLAKDAEGQSKKLRAEANRVAPRSTLMTWRREGLIDDDEFRSMMRERGYPDVDVERYLSDAKRDKPRPPKPSPTSPPWPRPKGSAHPAQARLLKWYNDGVISLEDYGHALTDLGYSPGDVGNYVRDAAPATNGQAPRPPSGEAPPQA